MKRVIRFFICFILVIGVFCAFPYGVIAANQTYQDVELTIGQVLHSSSFIKLSEKTCICYYSSAKEEKATEMFVYEAGRDPAVKIFWDTFDWVVLENAIEDGIRYIGLFPYVNDGVGGVETVGLATDETVLGGSWMDFKDCGGKTRTIRYFKEGEAEPFHTQTSKDRYMQVLKRTQTASFAALDYSVSYWRVKNVDSGAGTVDLVAGKDIGLANMVKANEMYRTQIIPAGTLIDFSAARYVSLHFYSSEYMYDKGKEFYCFDYYDKKAGEEWYHIAGQDYAYTAYQVMSANIHHIHLVALDGYFEMPDESVVYGNDLKTGDVVYNGSVLSFGSSTVNYRSSDGTLLSSVGISSSDGITIANPDGFTAGSWVVSAIDSHSIDLTALDFLAEGLLIPSDENQDKNYYSGACMTIDGKKYYYYDALSVAIVDAKVNTSLTLKDLIGEENKLNDDLDCDRVLLLKNVEKIDANIGAIKGVRKGILIDFNGHSASSVYIGTISTNEALVFTNSREQKSFITGADAIIDNNKKEKRTGTVIFNNLNIASKIHPAMHKIYLLNGEYFLNSATVMDKECDNSIIKDNENCPLYKFYENYPYWTCSVTPADPSADYPNGKEVERNGKIYYFYSDMAQANSEARGDDVINPGNAIPSPKPTIGKGGAADDDIGRNTLTPKHIITIVIVVVVAAGAATGIILFKRRSKTKKHE